MTRSAADEGCGLLMVLVDALRWDYPARAPFLRDLSARSTTGRLVEPFGFTPRSAYFNGIDVLPGGFTHMFEWNPESSPFGASRFLPKTEPIASADWIRAALRERAQALSDEFARHYIGPVEIPLEYLRFFDAAERRSAWAPSPDEGNLFALLRSHNQNRYVCAWPENNGLTDAAIVAQTLRRLKGDTRFAFVHLSGLDSVGHVHGPGSREVQRTLEDTDGYLRTLVDHARSIWRHPIVILFGDHGMVPVVQTLDLMPAIRSTGLTFGREFGFFVDSTTVRFWYFTADARKGVRDAFSGLACGHFLNEEERGSFGLDRAGWRNGEDFFLADPGILFSPSFFGRAPLKGMHGFDPNTVDNQGAFIYWNPDDETPREAGAVRASRLFSTVLSACGIDVPSGRPDPVNVGQLSERRAAYTARALPHHEALIDRDLETITSRVLDVVPDCEAIVLAGSFGRGEGAVRDDPCLRAVNDYDVLVIGGRPRTALEQVRTALEADCHVDAIDLGWVDSARRIGPSQLGFDLRCGSKVLYGDPRVFDRWGTVTPADLTMTDAWLGLSNRACGLLEVIHRGDGSNEAAIELQLTKFRIAVGDAYLILLGDYHVKMSSRMVRLQDLARSAGLPASTVEAVSSAYAAKLGLNPGPTRQELEGLLDAPEDLARRTRADQPLPCVAAAQAVLGRCRQTPTPGDESALAPECLADLEAIYREGWRLLQQAVSGTRSISWAEERDHLTTRWHEVIH